MVSIPFIIHGPQPMRRPVLLAVPHAGRDYSADLLASARVSLDVLRRLEDVRADLLVEAAVRAGFTAIVATAPRALIDLNRAEHDLDPAAVSEPIAGLRPSLRARSGLGLVPTRLAGVGSLWRSTLAVSALRDRVATIHRPYHEAIDRLLATARDRWGATAFLDIHSMPTLADPVDVVLGDRYGLTASSELVDRLLAVIEGQGLSAARNHPYAGAFGIERHSHRSSGSEALQVEIARDLYMEENGKAHDPGCARVAAMVCRLAQATEASLFDRTQPTTIAAE